MTTLFPPTTGPRAFGLPSGIDFATAFVAGLDARLEGQPPEAVARVEIWVNARRAQRALVAAFARGPARLLPRIRVVTELGSDPLAPLDLGPPVPALRRRLELARLIGGMIAAGPQLAAPGDAFELAESLGDLLDEAQGEGLTPDVFGTADPGPHAEHWRRSLTFLDLLREYAAAAGMTDGQGRMRAVADALAAAWAVAPPAHPVIVAGSTGSRGATLAFMAAVARLPQGALVLPGLDLGLPAAVWDRLRAEDPGAADHPQYGFRRLAETLGFDPAAVPSWHSSAPPAPERNALVSLALRPAPVTSQWRAEGSALAGKLAGACAGLTWIEAQHPRAEALALALALREAAEGGTRAALVTPDRTLARRVTAELDRWGIVPDDSAGRPLALTPPGVLLRRLGELPGAPVAAAQLLALLKHPLVGGGGAARGEHLRLTARLEHDELRGKAPWIDWDRLAAWSTKRGGTAPAWIAWLREALAPLAAAGPAPLAEHVARHRAAAEALAAGREAAVAHGLWERGAGLAALAMMEELAAEADACPAIHASGYRALLQSLMAARDVPEEAVVAHPDIAIWGTLEARVQSAELVILGSLNEGTWPRLPGADPWLSRALRRELGLPSPERQIGLSAHDFQQAMGAAHVIVSRATRDAEAPTVASRWLLRIENLLLGLGDEGKAALDAAKARGAHLLGLTAALDSPAAIVPPARRPSPRPPAAARPAELSVTQLETLVRDPYAIYARHVLRFKRLDPPGREADPLLRGSAIHKGLDDFLAATEAALPDDALDVLTAVVQGAFAAAAPWPAVRAIWNARFAKAADWFLAGEAERRARGRPLAREATGRRAMDGLDRPFAVTARADRIDAMPGGAYAIYDYKSSRVPSAAEAGAFHLQLPLEAAIAAAGGFGGLAPGRAGHLELIGVFGQKARLLDAAPEAVDRTWARLRTLIAFYQDPASGFTARLRPQSLKYESDYDHLSRKGEWADGDPPDPEVRAVNGAVEAQVRAALPGQSSWVSANAGSGKTRVLTDRVARLLLAGTDPAKVLCLTYTKAAAAEMQSRLFRTLGSWAMLDDDALRAALAELGEPQGGLPPARLERARTLFARALETPGGLKIQTIHAFCEALLRRFPLEAGVAPQFGVLEDRQARALREAVLDALAATEPAAFDAMARYLGGGDPDALVQEIGRHRAAFAGPFDPARLAAALGAVPGITVALSRDRVMTPDAVGTLTALAPRLKASGPNDCRAAAMIEAALALADPGAQLEALEGVLLTGAGAASPFTAKTGSFPTSGVRRADPGLIERLDALMERVEAARPLRLAAAAFERSVALNVFARAWLAAFDARKRELGLLDFDDMIDRARLLLTRPGTAAWVLWRLDGGIDHILVDEAQDTSPAQWRVIEAVSDEFFAGEGAREVARTVFVVGDEKQSIYSFQGADPVTFVDMRAHFGIVLTAIGAALQHCDLLYSFRSSPPILALVDAVFSGPAGDGLAGPVDHRAQFPEQPGRVELWPFLPKPEKPQERPWDDPVDAPPPDDPVRALARRIAESVAGWLTAQRPLPGAGRAVRAGDVLILVQRRGSVFDAVIHALKRARVPVAGADLLRVGGELAVRDLLAALRVAATPADDLSLAAFLRSPLGEMSEAELFDLAHGRTDRLWDALRAAPPERWEAARALLHDMRNQADYLRPYELLSRMLVRHGGRRRLVARLGAEAEDGIDALLDQALEYERVEPPSLTGFLDWIDRGELTAKRRSDENTDQVRVMTVHGAKGLEAPIVILPDTAARQEAANPPAVLPLGGGQAAWRMRADAAPAAMAGAERDRRALVRAENRRLLYVAMTRARTWLIVCGAGAPPTNGSESWHALVADAMNGLAPTTEPGADGPTLALEHRWDDAPAPVDAAETAAAGTLPDWALRPARRPAEPPAALSPSALGGAHVLGAAGMPEEAEAAMIRGTALHRLFEALHGRPAADWPALAARVLPDHAERELLLAEAAVVLSAPELAGVFAPGTLAEVDVAAPLPGFAGARMLGRIDRLVLEADRVLAVDFKSHRDVPDRPEVVPEAILRQMGAYRAALAAIWPGRRAETAILWTRTALLMPLPGTLVDAALARAADLDPTQAGS